MSQELSNRLTRARPLLSLKRRGELLSRICERLQKTTLERFREVNGRLRATADKLKLLGPEQVLARGYSITFDESSGIVLRNSSEVKPGSRLRTMLNKGVVKSRVEEH